MGRPPSPAQRAVQITFVLKGHLKNVQVAYIRVAALLARVRDEKLYRALGHATMDDYAAARLGLQHAQLYRYLAVYDWIREFHRPWLARRPKGKHANRGTRTRRLCARCCGRCAPLAGGSPAFRGYRRSSSRRSTR